MNAAFYIAFLPLFLLLLVLWLMRRRRLAVVAHILNKKMMNKDKDRENEEMKELAKRFIGKECIIYMITSESGNFQGIIREVGDGGMVVERLSGESEIVNLEFVTRIREYPKNKNGKKKSLIVD